MVEFHSFEWQKLSIFLTLRVLAGTVAQSFEPTPVTLASHTGMSACLSCSTSDPATANTLGKQTNTVQLFGPLPPMWKAQKKP